ncbi:MULTISPECIES: ECF transporter S component [Anaerotruncus]|nr:MULTISPECIES: ECF transporter S component [Anaerotruncus]MCI8491883.1 ECF transporter S component [Anaerotruncus sp.]MCR2025833.1 ECF transporter S component [Anaerotruncus colihominis]
MRGHISKAKALTLIGLLAAVEVVLTLTPLGFVPLGVTKATTIHIPVILGAVLLGPAAGAVLGGVFGVLSVLTNTFQPTVTSFVFTPFYALTPDFSGNGWSLVVAIVPRILIGVVSAYVFRVLARFSKGRSAALIGAGIVGSLTNTILVMGGIYLFFGESYAAAKGIAFSALFGVIMGVIGINGVLEAIVAAILTLALGRPLVKAFSRLS